jgi:hypothetical protein
MNAKLKKFLTEMWNYFTKIAQNGEGHNSNVPR